MVDISRLSAAKLEALYDKRSELNSAACKACIAAGLGMVRHNDLAATGHEAAIHYLVTFNSLHEVVSEMGDRKRWHGSLKPIKRSF